MCNQINKIERMLALYSATQDAVQEFAAKLQSIAHSTFAAGTYEEFPDSYDWCEMAHEVRNNMLRATVVLVEVSNAIEEMELYGEERRDVLEMRSPVC